MSYITRVGLAVKLPVLLLLAGCATRGGDDAATGFDAALASLDERPGWEADRGRAYDAYRHPFEAALAGKVIALDPGHGGQAHRAGYKRGPTGLREAEVNLRVALLLERMLADAGARVVLTRREDVDSTLTERATVAADAGADVFISLHHNAAGSPNANYPSVWHHGDPADAGSSVQIAAHLGRELGRAMRTDVVKTSPVMSDLQMYETGFGVLRAAAERGVPSVLTESSFYTDPAEEGRLADPAYNLREAHAIYLGLCEYFRHGVPTQAADLDGPTLRAELTDGLPPWWGHELRGPQDVILTVAGERTEFTLDGNALAADVGESGEVRLTFRNVFGHANHPQVLRPASSTDAEEPIALAAVKTITEDDAVANALRPWAALPRADGPYEIHEAGVSGTLDHGLSLPAGSALTVAEVDPATGKIHARSWNNTGERGFYPASTIKLVTALMTLDLLAEHGLTPDADLKLGDGERGRVGDLLTAMIQVSDNDDFNTLQEAVGFKETAEAMRSWGIEDSVIRRHFKRPRYNSSAPVTLWNADGEVAAEIPARPGVDFPLNKDGGESNLFTTDDLVRLLAATFQGEARERPGFDALAEAMRQTNERFLGRGLDQFGERYVSYNKPGWWPGDGANVDAAYVFDTRTGRHFYVGVYYQAEPDVLDPDHDDPLAARGALAEAATWLFEQIDAGKITFVP